MTNAEKIENYNYFQETIGFGNNESVQLLEKLERDKKPLSSTVEIDAFTNEASKNFDYDFDGKTNFYPFKISEKIKQLDFNILCIVGASGSGKSTLSKYWGEEEPLFWDNSKAVVSHFKTPQEAIEKLCAVGFNSIPSWCKPRNVLSVGEGFRVDLARRIKDNCVIDEFTSTVDRNVALSCACSVGKYIRKFGIKKCVFVSCHKDFIDTLLPDYVIDLDKEAIYDTRRLPKRNFKLEVYRTNNKREMWELFRNHHYLNGKLNVACEMFVAKLGNTTTAMIAMLPQPNGYCLNGFRVHRLVVLPDFQGLGIGIKLLEWVCEYYNSQNKIVYIRTSHIKLVNSLLGKPYWKQTHRSKQKSPKQPNKKWKETNRTPYSFQYAKNDLEKIKSLNISNKQINIFNMEIKELLK